MKIYNGRLTTTKEIANEEKEGLPKSICHKKKRKVSGQKVLIGTPTIENYMIHCIRKHKLYNRQLDSPR